MVYKKKVKPEKNFLMILLVVSFLLFLSHFQKEGEKVEILYFRSDKCPIAKTTDAIISQAISEFNDKINVKIINSQLYPEEPEDSEEVKQLREKYNVIGLPEIIINGKKFKKQFTKNNLFEEICNNFIVKPEGCK
jgi:thiol-disulfide isomerase/thioredoxin